ncbi:MAG: hypothetical protein E5V74_06215 [Mesorhizobium sp.]|nr:MAG: hypothetical protein E5V86_10125 [Mesorhizobium sp.]TIW04635.1 MAG: hypothetical protein E5V74_06215 [Mesorhizobium sp.]
MPSQARGRPLRSRSRLPRCVPRPSCMPPSLPRPSPQRHAIPAPVGCWRRLCRFRAAGAARPFRRRQPFD